MTPPTGKPNIKHRLDRPDSDYDHYIEIYKNGNQFTAVKKDSKPILNESTYKYEELEKGRLEFKNGKKSCSGAGKYRNTTPNDKIDDKIRELATPLMENKIKHDDN